MMIKPMTCFRNLCLLYLLLFHLTGQGIELATELSDNQLTIIVTDINYPERIIDKELKSGLPNDISLLISLSQDDKKVFVTRLNYKITYDLWDEVYQVKITSDNSPNVTQVLKVQQELMGFIRRIKFTSKDAVSNFQVNTTYSLTAQVLVNPVKKERIDKIKRWIAESQGFEPAPDNEQGAIYAERSTNSPRRDPPGSAKSSSFGNQTGGERVSANRPRFQKLFDRILEQYIDEDEIPALWHSQVLNKDIRLKSSASEE